jgi:hypothetical protein
MVKAPTRDFPALVVALVVSVVAAAWLQPADPVHAQGPAAKPQIPRDANGRPNLSGIWQVRNRASYNLEDHHARYQMPPGRGVVDGGTIPYQEWALKKRDENYANRYTEDPLSKCHMPGVPRIMYMEHPFQIFQTRDHVAMTFEWSLVHRLIYTNGSKHNDGLEFFMGDSRGRWEGDTLVVDVANHNDRTWFDMAGNFHSNELRLTERYTMLDPDTIRYEVTVEDPKVFSRPWKMSMPLYRHKDMDRLLEYHCYAEKSEQDGSLHRDPTTWFPKP